MVQGAIDLVQMEQQRVDAAAARRRLRRYRQYYHPPKLLATENCSSGALCSKINHAQRLWPPMGFTWIDTGVAGGADAAELPTALPCQNYSWEDQGPRVVLRVPLPAAVSPFSAQSAVQCTCERQRLKLTISESEQSCGVRHVLQIHTLYAAVEPEKCHWQLDNGVRFPTLPDADAAGSAVVMAGRKPWVIRLGLRKAEPTGAWPELSALAQAKAR